MIVLVYEFPLTECLNDATSKVWVVLYLVSDADAGGDDGLGSGDGQHHLGHGAVLRGPLAPGQRVRTHRTVIKAWVTVVAEEVVASRSVLHAGPVQLRHQPQPHAQLVRPVVVLNSWLQA